MIKYILPLFLLTGCATATVTTPSPGEIPHEVPRLTEAWVNGVHVACAQEEVNDALVWQECLFTNTMHVSRDVCVQLEYLDVQSDPVALSRTICSGPLLKDEFSARYIAFTKKNRQKLSVCGPDLKSCFTMFQVIKE